jgi:hypothetical protein
MKALTIVFPSFFFWGGGGHDLYCDRSWEGRAAVQTSLAGAAYSCFKAVKQLLQQSICSPSPFKREWQIMPAI